MDEPFSALDADLRQQMRQLVGELQKRQKKAYLPQISYRVSKARLGEILPDSLIRDDARARG